MPNVDRRIQKTKTAINKAFLELLSEKDFDQITINNISEQANVNRGTIYLHYKDKYDLLDKCIEDNLKSLQFFTDSIKSDQNFFDVNDTFMETFLYFERNYLFYSIMLANKGTHFFRDRFKDVIISGISKQLTVDGINKNLDKDFFIQYISSALVGIVEWWIKNNMPLPPQMMAQHMLELYKQNGKN